MGERFHGSLSGRIIAIGPNRCMKSSIYDEMKRVRWAVNCSLWTPTKQVSQCLVSRVSYLSPMN